MAVNVIRPSGDEWQNWANMLLTCHYGPAEYQRVPDNQKGDAGVEGFTVTEGHVYQCYGCEEPVSTTVRYQKQRDKMSADIKKFIDNKITLGQLFGATKVTRWLLFVPYCDSKDIVIHAQTKTAEVIAHNLPYVGSNFRIMVVAEDDFSNERKQLLSNAPDIRLSIPPVDDQTVTNWATQNDQKVVTLEDKIKRMPTIATQDKRNIFRNQVLKWHIEGQELLSSLKNRPEIREKILEVKAHRENYLVTACALSVVSPAEVMRDALSAMLSTLLAEVRGLSKLNLESLAHEAVSDWLLRCPLDFP